MNPRLLRLMADYQKIQAELAGHPYIKVQPLEGNPPERYLVVYTIKGLRLINNRPVETNSHQVEIYLARDYPREKPKCEIKTEIFHPNFKSKGQVCIGEYWSSGETLVDVIIQIGQMIQYQSYNPKSPLNAEAALWCRQNENLFPIGNTDLYQPEPEITLIDPEKAEKELDIDLI